RVHSVLGRETVVDAGVLDKELVVTEGQLRLSPGAAVAIRETADSRDEQAPVQDGGQ
ncbi:MAG: hypothetical protein GX055_08310, partial [Desulfovibrionales bacterium]|nr:hypothetical protein [Desulfovibrionales bacterium]